jgi:hypothetical protein
MVTFCNLYVPKVSETADVSKTEVKYKNIFILEKTVVLKLQRFLILLIQ